METIRKAQEEWRPVVGFEQHYQVSNFGEVMRLARGPRTRPGRLLRRRIGNHGYDRAALYVDGMRHDFQVHILVAAAFIGLCPVGQEVNHKNGIKSDNCVANLEYVTRKQNVCHARDVLRTMDKRYGEHNSRAILTESQVVQIRQLSESVPRKLLADKFGVCKGTIAHVLDRTIWKHVA